MTSTDAAAEARETVYAAIELSKKTWVLGIAPPDRDRPSIYRVSGGDARANWSAGSVSHPK